MTSPSVSTNEYASYVKDEVLIRCSPDTGTAPLMVEAFTSIVLEDLVDHNEVSDWSLCAYEAKAHGKIPAARLSAWNLSGDGATLELFVSLYQNEDEPRLVTRAETEQQFKLVRSFLVRALDGLHTKLDEAFPVFDAARQIYESKDCLTSVRLFFLTDGVVKSADIDEEQIEGIELRYSYWDIEKLSRLRVGTHETIELDFVADYGGPIPCIAMQDATSEYTTYLAFLPASKLALIYGTHGQRLLERNVRAFLSAKGKVNKGLQETITTTPHRFLAYNNGLCCTAAEVDVEVGAVGHASLLRVKDFQIVNGGQTTASIFHAQKKEKIDVSKVVVQLKLTVLSDPEKVVEIVPLISKYANSQNKVNTADFSANDAFHQGLEMLSRTIWAPASAGLASSTRWYYERARGSFLDDKSRAGTPANRRKWEEQHPQFQKFTKTDVAKFENTWNQFPHKVSLGDEKNFTNWTLARQNSAGIEVNKDYFERLVAKAILFRSTKKIVTALNFGGYRANIITYTIAWLSLDLGQRIDLKKIWQKQSIGEPLAKAIEIISRKANEIIQSENRSKQNVGEWCKQEECWLQLRDVNLELPDLASEMLPASITEQDQSTQIVSPERTAKGAKLSNGEMVAGFQRLRLDTWSNLSAWGEKSALLKPWQVAFATNIGRKVASGRSPTPLECRSALALLVEAQALGFTH